MPHLTNLSTFPACFWAKVSIQSPDECWPWLAGKTSSGYGAFWMDWKQMVAHRVAYELVNGPVPEGLQLDHLCRNRPCCNPKHLEPVTLKQNVLRGIGITAICAKKTSCKNGHEFDEANTYLWHGDRYCRQCKLDRQNAAYRLKSQRQHRPLESTDERVL